MNRPLLSSTFLLALALPALAQQPTAAEAAYRDAWWAESGQGDLATALKGYLAAAAAEGPAGIRAKALLGAGAVQQRLGKSESAIATFKQLLQQYPGEADLVERARTHLRELTAVDLRDGYDEWYQRRLFSEEVQLEILQKIQVLGSKVVPPGDKQQYATWRAELNALSAEILGFGAGAVPALRKAAESANEQLASRAIRMLFQLGEVPAVAGLQRYLEDWGTLAPNWQRLLALPAGPAAALRAAIQPGTRGAGLLAGALQGPKELVAAMVAIADTALVANSPEVLAAATSALLHASADSRRATLAALVSDAVPLRVREAMERAVVDAYAPLPFGAKEWLAVGAEPLHYGLRLQCIQGAARTLQAIDGDVLDEILVRIANSPGTARSEWTTQFCYGMAENLAPLQVPWTLSRLRAAVRLFPDDTDPTLSPVFAALQRSDLLRALLAEALLGEPEPMQEAYPGEGGMSLAMHFAWDGDGAEIALLATRWNRTVAGCLGQLWPGFGEAQRLAVLALLPQVVSPDAGDRRALATFLEQADPGTGQRVRDAITALRLRWGC